MPAGSWDMQGHVSAGLQRLERIYTSGSSDGMYLTEGNLGQQDG